MATDTKPNIVRQNRSLEASSSLFGLDWETQLKPVFKWVTIAVIMFWMLFPVYYTVVQSLKTPSQIFTTPLGVPWLTFDIAPASKLAWLNMWEAFPFVEYTLATVVVAIGTAGLATIVGIFAAYAFARLRFPLKRKLFIFSVSGFLFPKVLLTIPIFVMMNRIQLLNTYIGMILGFTAFTLPYNIWLLRGFFEDLPENLEESARVDGCSKIGAFVRVIVPLSRPAIASVFLLAFLLAWHNYVMAFILAKDPLHKTLPVGLLQLRGTFFVRNFHFIMAGTFITLLVPMVLYMYLQRHLVEGLSAAAGVKG